MIHLKIITASTRPQRKGPALSAWILEKAKAHKQFKAEHLDLAEINLPFLDEPEMANLQHYRHEHTKRWSRMIDEGDAFIFVTPEYNNSFPATLKNALDFLFNEWNMKPAAFVSYGGVSGGTRSVQMLKIVVASLKMYAVKAAVNVPFFEKRIKDGVFESDKEIDQSANDLFAELLTWAEGLKAMRQKK